MIIGTIVPNNYYAPWDFVKSILSLPPKYSYIAIEGASIPDNRNQVFNIAKKNGDDLLFVDSDIVFKPEDVARIESGLKRGLDCLTGVYVLGQPPYVPCIFKRIKSDYELTLPEEGIKEIGACGAGFLGISKNVIQQLPENPFSNIWEGKIQHGEDVSFCHRLHKSGFKLWCDSDIQIGHIRTMHKYYE